VYKSHGDGKFLEEDLGKLGIKTIIENTVKIFNPNKVFIGSNSYIGHDTKLYGYPFNTEKSIVIGDRCWIGYNVVLSGAGSIIIGNRVGIGPGVHIYSSEHELSHGSQNIMDNPLKFLPVIIEDGADIGAGSIIRAGVTIGKYAQIGMGSIILKSVKEGEIVAGNPAHKIRDRYYAEPIMNQRIA